MLERLYERSIKQNKKESGYNKNIPALYSFDKIQPINYDRSKENCRVSKNSEWSEA